MPIFTVTNTNDSGAGSLREAVALANLFHHVDIIKFDPTVFAAGATITLTSGELVLGSDTTIDGDVNGDNKADVTISGNNDGRVFSINDSVSMHAGHLTDVNLRSLTLTNGAARGFAFGEPDDGGAIYTRSGGTLDISDCTIKDSVAKFGGGGLHVNSGVVRIVNSLFTGNSAGDYGGGIRNFGASVTLVNSTVSGNTTAGTGGGIISQSGSLTMVNSTVTLNRADTDGALTANGGGLYVEGSATVTINNSVISGNTSSSANTVNDTGGYAVTLNSSLVGGNAQLGALQNNGGTVLTHALLAGSPLINGGNNALLPADFLDIDGDGSGAETLPIDGRGAPRVQGNTVDIGAVEAPLILVTTAADVVNAGDGVLSLREAVTLANSNADASTIVFATALAGQTLTLTGGELTLTQDVTIDGDITGDNRADITLSGGGASRVIHNTGGGVDAVLASLTLTGGTGVGAGLNGFGGAVLSRYGTMTIKDSTIRDSAAIRGGGVYGFYSALTMVNSLVTGNSASADGGGVAIRGAAATIVNTTIHGNDALGFAGGIRLSGLAAVATVINSTVTGNHAATGNATTTAGGGLELVNGATAVFRNSVVADNRSGNGVVEHDFAGSVTASNSVFGTAVTIGGGNGVNLTNVANVGLGNLLDNGGPTLTRSPLDGSVLIGAGANALLPLDVLDIDGDGNVTEVLPRDGRGGVRVTGVVDVGAVEQRVNETIGGTAIADTIIGGLGLDTLSGLAGIDILNGGDGDDILIGGAGGDTLIGGPGSDTASYVGAAARVKVALDNSIVFEGDALGDTFNSIARLIGTGSSDILIGDLNGNIINGGSSNDTIRGQAGNDILRGDMGGDNISGGLGDDKFSFLALDQAGDLINDFTNAAGNNDIFNFKGSAFGGLAAGALAANRFVANLTGLATTADHRFIYETDTGILRFDSNGNVAGGVTVIATLTGAPVLTLADFAII